MSCENLIIPKSYSPILGLLETERAIKICKDNFEHKLSQNLNLERISAPLFVNKNSGLNDNLNGTERPVAFDTFEVAGTFEIVHSLAKWKRLALHRYKFTPSNGLYTDMNAIRRDEQLDNLHSLYVDQWDWEKIITVSDRKIEYLQATVTQIVKALYDTHNILREKHTSLPQLFTDEVYFVTSQQLEDSYPNLTPKQREDEICKENKIVFIMQIGGILNSGIKHDGRAPDYDDWQLNGDLLVWYPLLDRAVEISSMGIRVDADSLKNQLKLANEQERSELPFHKMLLNNELPLTIGGGIGQSRICMLMLNKAHIGEVSAAVWSDDMIELCEKNNIFLL